MDRNQLIFFEEASDLLTELEEATLAIESDRGNTELIGRIFRAIHTLKGSSAMFGCDVIAHFAHDVENAFDRVRQGKMTVTPKLITLTLASRDHIAVLFQFLLKEQQPSDVALKAGENILAELRQLLSGDEEPSSATSAPSAGVSAASETAAVTAANEASEKKSMYRIRWRPPQNIYLTGSNPQYLIDEVKEMGDCDVILHSDGLPSPEEINPDFCYFRWDMLLLTSKDDRAIRDVFIFVEDESELRIELLGNADLCDTETRRELNEALSSTEDATLDTLKNIISPHTAELQTAPAPTAATVGGQPQSAQPSAPQQEHKSIQNIKVPSERLDKLVDLVGELVIVQARLSQAASSSVDTSFVSIAEQIEALVWELRDNAMSIRMLPIGTTFGKFNRLVRDLSAELGKEIQLVTEGEDTELDKTVIERLGDPLVHMIRNCIDHGIETPSERLAAGKPRAGMIRLSAAHTGAFVQISIVDDGRGLNTEAIFNKAVSQGLINPDDQLTEQELFALIFRPGFSTTKVVTNVSGRGVGMDVVRRSIDDLGGQIEISSRLNKGTTIVLKIPLTLAIVEGLLVKVGVDFYIIPLSIVKECVELPSTEDRRGNGGELINVRGDIVPYIRLHDFYETKAPAAEHEYVVIVESDKSVLGFAVDVVCGQHQTVIKGLGAMYSGVKGVSGATILGDGTVALIVDVPAIIAETQHDAKKNSKSTLMMN
ncbi:MAG TPA: chemotaxis protein CheA [Bacteroidota bacterium]|nr:chemotaxis protein CheA [Bacteroidota bacterium]